MESIETSYIRFEGGFSTASRCEIARRKERRTEISGFERGRNGLRREKRRRERERERERERAIKSTAPVAGSLHGGTIEWAGGG